MNPPSSVDSDISASKRGDGCFQPEAKFTRNLAKMKQDGAFFFLPSLFKTSL